MGRFRQEANHDTGWVVKGDDTSKLNARARQKKNAFGGFAQGKLDQLDSKRPDHPRDQKRH
jgi:hypothetical protein